MLIDSYVWKALMLMGLWSLRGVCSSVTNEYGSNSIVFLSCGLRLGLSSRFCD